MKTWKVATSKAGVLYIYGDFPSQVEAIRWAEDQDFDTGYLLHYTIQQITI